MMEVGGSVVRNVRFDDVDVEFMRAERGLVGES